MDSQDPGVFKVFSNFCLESDRFFYFNGIAFCGNTIVIGTASDVSKKNLVEHAVEGRFFAASSDGVVTRFWTDDTGQELLFYYCNGDKWAVSNSFKKLADFLSDKRVEMTVNHGALLPFAVRHSSSQGLMTNKAIINEINILGADEFLEADNHQMKVISRSGPDEEYDFSALVNRFIEKWSSRLKVIVDQMPAGSVICDLTGGVDSRVIFSLLLASGCDLNKISFNCNERWEKDYNVAKIIASKYGLSLNESKRRTPYPVSPDLRLNDFLDSCLGVYHGAYFSNYENFSSGAVHLHGGGGGLIRSVYSHNPSNMLLSKGYDFPSQVLHKKSISEVGEFNASVIESSSDSNVGRSIRYYFETRNRYHFGRNSYKSLSSYLVTPLVSKEVMKLSGLYGVEDRDVYIAIFLLTDPGLIDIEFDEESKAFDFDRIDYLKSKISPGSFNISEEMEVKIIGGWPRKDMNDEFKVREGVGYREALLYRAKEYIEDPAVSAMLSDSVSERIVKKIKEFDTSGLAIRDYLHVCLLRFAKDKCSGLDPMR